MCATSSALEGNGRVLLLVMTTLFLLSCSCFAGAADYDSTVTTTAANVNSGNDKGADIDDGVSGNAATPEERFGVKQRVEGQEAGITRDLILDTVQYMENEVFVKPEYVKVRDQCQNEHDLCAFWAATGQCNKENKAYMQYHCAPSCKTCHLIDYETRCLSDDILGNLKDDMKMGGLSELARRINDPESDISKKYRPTIYFQPQSRTCHGGGGGGGEADATPTVCQEDKDTPSIGPLVATLDSFLSDAECDRMIELGYEQGFGENNLNYGSTEGDQIYGKGENGTHIRSDVAHCSKSSCHEDEVIKSVLARISMITGMPVTNIEEMQILRYKEGQYIGRHVDGGDFEVTRPCGPSVLTFLLYLSDVGKGGGTHFPLLDGLTITPKRGSALLWSNVLDNDLNAQDLQAEHEGLPVEAGVKFAVNAFIHLRDFSTAHRDGCC